MNSRKSFLFKIIGIILILAIGASLGFWFGYSQAKQKLVSLITAIHPVRENNSDYKFIAPLLLYDFGTARQYFLNSGLQNALAAYVQSAKQNGIAVSVAVRDFSANRSATVNADVQYHPGSMMKVVIMMGYFREAQRDPNAFAQRTLLYSKVVDQQTNAVPFALKTALTVGKSYTISELLQEMIANSDNGAETLLLDNIDSKVLNQVYADLNLPVPNDSSDYTISVNQYTDFLRILYNATYLDEQYSEQSLKIMSQSTYRDGITAGVPVNITVAQKYGERVDSDSNNQITAVELSNCGIVYAPNHSYSLCIMTKKSTDQQHGVADQKALAGAISDISRLVYNYSTTH